jgi:hypothetical protein
LPEALTVIFQQDADLALTEEAEIADALASLGEPNGHPQECAADAGRSRNHDFSQLTISPSADGRCAGAPSGGGLPGAVSRVANGRDGGAGSWNACLPGSAAPVG